MVPYHEWLRHSLVNAIIDSARSTGGHFFSSIHLFVINVCPRQRFAPCDLKLVRCFRLSQAQLCSVRFPRYRADIIMLEHSRIKSVYAHGKTTARIRAQRARIGFHPVSRVQVPLLGR